MSDCLATIRERRSVRQYDDQPVSDERVNQLLEAVRWAPSWANTQCWEIVVVREPERKQALQSTVPSGNPGGSAVGSAPVVLALCGQLKRAGYYHGASTTIYGDWLLFDLGIVSQNIALTAQALGLGTVVIGMLDHQDANRILHLPEGYTCVALMPLGYPAKIGPAPRRREIEDFTHHEVF